ncbi:hypothetical protein HanXRQr2_Chr14g0659741 [Helianthus annuus]|uniref:Uncharacterized protein n=1 Tax=Helianthus annuus TaxID=4232 RepID=A0A9K3EC23_HELAN|nr:hypothetical protein HanXRQr2_Chr14g0659741 [Helianthus annuus]KAJ0841649.1 hypothetical protein HanPSC8_Chr14g0632831 [Helianthus annuus]
MHYRNRSLIKLNRPRFQLFRICIRRKILPFLKILNLPTISIHFLVIRRKLHRKRQRKPPRNMIFGFSDARNFLLHFGNRPTWVPRNKLQELNIILIFQNPKTIRILMHPMLSKIIWQP